MPTGNIQICTVKHVQSLEKGVSIKIKSTFNNILIELIWSLGFTDDLFAMNQILLQEILKYFIKVIFTQIKMKQALPQIMFMIF